PTGSKTVTAGPCKPSPAAVILTSNIYTTGTGYGCQPPTCKPPPSSATPPQCTPRREAPSTPCTASPPAKNPASSCTPCSPAERSQTTFICRSWATATLT